MQTKEEESNQEVRQKKDNKYDYERQGSHKMENTTVANCWYSTSEWMKRSWLSTIYEHFWSKGNCSALNNFRFL